MTLRYILLELDYDTYIVTDNDLRYEFLLHTRYISNWFSKAIRRHKIDTNGIFKMISIDLLPKNQLKPTRIVALDVLSTYLPFDRHRYEKIKGTADCSYYLEMLEQGFKKAALFRPIPLEILLNLIEEFKNTGCKNEWIHKKKRFTEDDMLIILTCEFTTNYFQLVIAVNRISTKTELVRGPIIKTEPDEIVFEKTFKDVYVDEHIVITDSLDRPRIIIDKKKAIAGELCFDILQEDKCDYKEILSRKF